ncbi:MAG TPA: OmpA family protein, partial [Flavobacteriales bacterium]|nr:OmpA family protein [Flavobacteriales bacterium]
VKDRVEQHTIHFASSEAKVDEDGRRALKRICGLVADRDNYAIRITGHTDSVGGWEYNAALSARRADSIKVHLVRCGADPGRMLIASRSFSEPKAVNATEEGKAANRRTQVNVTLHYFSVNALEPVEGLRPGATFDLKVLFEFNTAVMKKESRKPLEEIAQLLSRYPEVEFEVLGWTAISQTKGDLSGERAKAVYDALVGLGIAPEQMMHKGMGGAQCPARLVEKCRRVEIAITRNPYYQPSPKKP